MTREFLIKEEIAISNNYPSWEEMYNWISRDNELPSVVAQLIEKITSEFYLKAINEWCKFNLEQREDNLPEVEFIEYLNL